MAQGAAAEQRRTAQGMGTFLLIWFGQLISILGSGLTGFALSVWVYQTTGSATQLTLIAFFAITPIIVFSPLVGVLIDRWEPRWTMMLSDVGGALATLSFVVLLSLNQLTIWHIYAIVGITGFFQAFQFPAFGAATTLIVPKQQLGRASGMMPLAQGIGQLVAPLLAGMLLMLIGLRNVIAIDLLTCLFAITTLLLVRFPPRATLATTKQRSSLWREMAYGWNYIIARPGLLSLLLFFATSNFMTSTVIVLANPLVLSFTTPAVLGTILSTAGVGVLVGSGMMSIWGGPRRRIHGVLGSLLLSGVCLIIGGLAPSALLIGVAAFFFTLGSPIVAGCSQAIWQSKVAPDVQGRVFATRGMIASSTLPLAYLLSGPLADYVFEPLMAHSGILAGSVGRVIGVGPGRGIALLLMVLGLLMILLVIAGYLYPRVRLVEDELPDAIADAPDVPAPAEQQPTRQPQLEHS